MSQTIAVLGGGTWGSTISGLLADKGYPVNLWDISEDVRRNLRENRIPQKLPHLELPEAVSICDTIKESVEEAETVVIVVPSHAVRKLCEEISKAGINISDKILVLCSKGIEQKTALPLSEVIVDVFGEEIRERLCCFSGPSHAEEVSKKAPTSVVAAAYTKEVARKVQNLLHTEFLRVYTQQDVLGVELGGSVKNAIAIAAGVCDGLGFGDNTKAALLTRGLAEIIRLGVAMGAKRTTFSGLSGMGDLIVTAMSRHSRNRNFGELLAKGRNVEEAQKEIGMVVEGIKTVDSVMTLAEKYGVAMPLSKQVHELIYHGKKPWDAFRDLMHREPKPEIYGPDTP